MVSRRVWACVAFSRIVMALVLPSYVHPDEFYQVPSRRTGQCERAPELTHSLPVSRGMCILRDGGFHGPALGVGCGAPVPQLGLSVSGRRAACVALITGAWPLPLLPLLMLLQTVVFLPSHRLCEADAACAAAFVWD